MRMSGLVTICKNEQVIMKIITGHNGFSAPDVVTAIYKSWPISAEEAYRIASEAGFGDDADLVVMTETETIFKGAGELSARYRQTFSSSFFNPQSENEQPYCIAIVSK
jgi:hypothetical protein